MLSLTTHTDSGIWGMRVRAYLHSVDDIGRRTLLAEHESYHYDDSTTADLDEFTAVLLALRAWAVKVMPPQPNG